MYTQIEFDDLYLIGRTLPKFPAKSLANPSNNAVVKFNAIPYPVAACDIKWGIVKGCQYSIYGTRCPNRGDGVDLSDSISMIGASMLRVGLRLSETNSQPQ